MALSAVDPLDRAFRRTIQILFKPFEARKWFVLGFCAWLAFLGEGGCNVNIPGDFGGPGRSSGPGFNDFPTGQEISRWFQDHMALILTIAAIAFAVIVTLGLLVTWVRSRAAFMFLDGVVRNRGAVVEPWAAFRARGNSLFKFSILFALFSTPVILAGAVAGLLIAWPDIDARDFGQAALIGLLVGVGWVLLTSIAAAVVAALLHDFVVPIMYLRNQRVMAAWSVLRREVVPGNVGSLIVFYILKILIAIGLGIVALVVTCITCCIAALPYIGTVILLPIYVFGRSYSIYFLEQLGPGWRFFPGGGGATCATCGEDLATRAPDGSCPRCGDLPKAIPPPA